MFNSRFQGKKYFYRLTAVKHSRFIRGKYWVQIPAERLIILAGVSDLFLLSQRGKIPGCLTT